MYKKIMNDTVVSLSGTSDALSRITIGSKEKILEKLDDIIGFMLFQVDNYDKKYFPAMEDGLEELKDVLAKKLPEQVTLSILVEKLLKFFPSEKEITSALKEMFEKNIGPYDSENCYWGGSRLALYISKWPAINALSLLTMSEKVTDTDPFNHFELFWDVLMSRLSSNGRILFVTLVNPSVFNHNLVRDNVATLFKTLVLKKFREKESKFMQFLIDLSEYQIMPYEKYFGVNFVHDVSYKQDGKLEKIWENRNAIDYLKSLMMYYSDRGEIDTFHKFLSMISWSRNSYNSCIKDLVGEFLRLLTPYEKLHAFSGNNYSLKDDGRNYPKYVSGYETYQLWNYSHYNDVFRIHMLDGIKEINEKNVKEIPYIIASYINNLKYHVGDFGEGRIDEVLRYEYPNNYFSDDYTKLFDFLEKYSQKKSVRGRTKKSIKRIVSK